VNTKVCPLCQNVSSIQEQKLACRDIEYGYLNVLNINIQLPGDYLELLRCEGCGLRFFSPIITGEAALYERLQSIDWYYLNDKPEYYLAQKWLPDSGEVLEIGAGKAAFANFVGQDRYVGLEFNDAAIRRASNDGVKLLKESVQQHAICNNGRYAAVVSFQVLEHVSEVHSFVASAVDLLVPGGILLLAVPNHDGVCGITQDNILDMPPHHVTHWGAESLNSIAKIFQLELVGLEQEEIASIHYDWACQAVWNRRLRRVLGLHARLIDFSIIGRVISRVARLVAKIFPTDLSGISGHTILACYKK